MAGRIRVVVGGTIAGLCGLLFASPAAATFPGTNGRIAFSQADLIAPVGGETGDLSAHSQVFTIRPNGTGLQRLTHVASDQAAGNPDWAPNGNRIAYISNETGGFQIWVMRSDGSHQRQVTDDAGFESFSPSWSPDGEHILFSHCAEPLGFIASCDIATINVDGTGLQTIFSAGRWNNVHPVYSPDGQWIAFGSDKGGFQSAIWVMGANGSSPNRLTAAKLRAFWPDWSPDGERILFSDNCCLPHSNLWTVAPDGSDLNQVTDTPEGLDTAFGSYSPNGKRIVTFFSRGCADTCRHFFTMSANGSDLRKVVTGKSNTFLTDWGPGG